MGKSGPFDRIIVTAAAPEIPNALIEQLTDNGIMIIPIGEDNDTQFLIKIKKKKKYSIKKNDTS